MNAPMIEPAARSLFSDAVPVSSILAKIIGRSSAALIQQIHYHLQKSKHVVEGTRWIYNSFKDWAEQLPFSDTTIKRAVSKLRDLGLIITERRDRQQWKQTNWYTIDYQRLECLIFSIGSFCPNRSVQIDLLVLVKMTRLIQESFTKKERTTHTPTHHPMNVDQPINGKRVGESSSGDAELEKAVAQAIAPSPLNAVLRGLISASDPDRVSAAIAAVREYRLKRPDISNLGGLMNRAISDGWKPSGEDTPQIPPGFDSWFTLARAVGVVSASQMVDGVMQVHSNAGWEDWGIMRSAFPISKLEEMERAIVGSGLKQD